MVEVTQLRQPNDFTLVRHFDGTGLRAILSQGSVSAMKVIVIDKLLEFAPKVMFAEYNDMVQTFSADGSN